MLSRFANAHARSVLALQPLRLTHTSTSKASAAADAVATEGGERDLVNFPRPQRAISPGKVRMGFIPEEWFTMFYHKTGVTGPYALGVGLTTFLCSKEIYIMEHEYYAGISIGLMVVYAINKMGPGLGAYLDKEVEKEDAEFNAGRVEALASAEKAIAAETLEQERAKAQVMLFYAKKENVALQLEAAYRANLMNVYTETKRRLDYQVECQAVERRMEQRQMVDWVIRNVKGAITPEQEQATLSQCITSLKSLAQANTARI